MTILYALLCAAQTASATVTWTQHSTQESNPGNIAIRPTLSCDGTKLFYSHPCQTDGCAGEYQDGGSVHQVIRETGVTTRLISGTLGTVFGINYVSANNDGSILAISSAVDHLGDLAPEQSTSWQVFIYEVATQTFTRLTSYESNEPLYPNISCDGNIICWTSQADPSDPLVGNSSQGRAYCYNRTTSVRTQITHDASKRTHWISPGNDGSTYVVSSREPLAGALPSGYTDAEEIYYWNGSAWSRITLVEDPPAHFEPRLSKDGSKIFFAVSASFFDGSAKSHKIAYHYSFATGLATRLFPTEHLTDAAIITNFISPNYDGSVVAVASSINLAGDESIIPPDTIFSGSYIPSDHIFQSGSPVNIIVTDPLGRTCSKTDCDIPGGDYYEFDFDGDGHPNDRVTVDPRLAGSYQVIVAPDGTQLHDDTYSLISASVDRLSILEMNALVPTNQTAPYIAPVPLPGFTLDLASGNIQVHSATIRLKGNYIKPEPTGPFSMEITDGANTIAINLCNIANYQMSPSGKSLHAVVKTDASETRVNLRKRFKKGTFIGWNVTIVGKGFDLAQFEGTADLAIAMSLTSTSGVLSDAKLFSRQSNGDLSFKK